MSPVEWKDAYAREQRRAETDRAIVEARLAPNLETLLHWLNRCVDEHGAVWKGAAALAVDLNWSETWVYILLDRACKTTSFLVQVVQGGGCHRTSTYALKIGYWRDDPKNPQMHHDWGERRRSILEKVRDWLEDVFLEHKERKSCSGKCWRFAPRWVKQEPIDWQLVT